MGQLTGKGLETVRYRGTHKDMAINDRVVVIEEVDNGLLKLEPFEEGKIIDLRGQVSAGVWFRGIGIYHDEPVTKALDLDIGLHKNGRLHGVVMELKRSSFAIRHRFGGEFDGLWIDEDKALTVPFFEKNEHEREFSNRSVNVGGGVFERIYHYPLPYIIGAVEEAFAEWVKQNLEMQKVTEQDREDRNLPSEWETCLTEKANDMFYEKSKEIELAFAKATGVYYRFDGGLVFE
ncbi:hypothetical protein [Bacillus thuringiensis]|uniref:hypothetical protein n=1 Tax=Bacillus thuringiensis TaxID=1428 RepID=UPI00159BB97E|nr:hypothetical protein [Bacillus thuringiensis]